MSDQAASSKPEVILFTDGACSGNPGPGGWACILRHVPSGTEKELSGGGELTTNNQMELQAVISGLDALKRPTRVKVVTDSAYVRDGCTKWLPGWKKNGFQRREGKNLKPLKNEDFWRRLDILLAGHQVTFELVKGHSGHPENERCDVLAVEATEKFKR